MERRRGEGAEFDRNNAAAASGDGGGAGGGGRVVAGPRKPPAAATAAGRVPLHRLFAFADRTDALLMAVGTLAAVANGMAQPLMTFIFGDVIDAFGSAESSNRVVHRVVKVPNQLLASFLLIFYFLSFLFASISIIYRKMSASFICVKERFIYLASN